MEVQAKLVNHSGRMDVRDGQRIIRLQDQRQVRKHGLRGMRWTL
jgi:hypothetical protein